MEENNTMVEQNVETAEVQKVENISKKKTKKERVKKEKKPHVKFKDLPKDKKKKRVKRSILIGIGVLVLFLIIFSNISAANAKLPVTVHTVKTGTVESLVTTTGSVESDEIKTYYSKIAADVAEIPVKVGTTVKKGDVLLKFDPVSLSIADKTAQATALTNEGAYKDAAKSYSKSSAELTESNTNLPIIEKQLEDYKALVKDQTRKLEAKKNARQATLNAQQMELTMDQNDGEDVKDEMAELQYSQSMISIDKDLTDMQHAIDDTNEIIRNLEEDYSEMKSQQGSSEAGVTSAATLNSKKVSDEAAKAQQEETSGYAAQVTDGLKADFDGVVTEVTAIAGGPVTDGASLLKIANNQKVHVTFNLSKTDLAKVKKDQIADLTIAGNKYEGKVSNISHMAVMNSNNTPVVSAEIEITNPDEDIYLGVEAKINIHAQKEENALLIPVEAINSDKNGDFVYIVENGVVVRRNVTTGVSSDEYTQIVEGIKEGDQVMTDISTGVTEGMQVTVIPQTDTEEGTTSAQQ